MSLQEYLAQMPEEIPHAGCGRCGSGATIQVNEDSPDSTLTTAVRYGYMRYVGEFTHPSDMRFQCGGKLVIQSRRGIELGEQVSLTCSGCSRSIPRETIKNWVRECGQDAYSFEAGRVLREATAADLAEFARIQAGCREKRVLCQTVADRHGLPISVIECECPFGGERIIFYFTAAERVDFRAMVRELAREYRTRIEMRQIGARDEARLMADFETCGREVCCKVFLKTLKPISMRMAKLQKATLDPSQVSGRCGRLKCCLRYEHESYEELDKQLPRTGVRIRAKSGVGVIVNRQVITQLVQIRTDGDTLVTVPIEEIEAVNVPAPTPEEIAARTKADQPARERRTRRPDKDRRGKTATGRRAERPSKKSEAPPRKVADKQPEPASGTPPAESPSDAPADGAPADKPKSRRRRSRRRRRPKGGGEGSSGGNA